MKSGQITKWGEGAKINFEIIFVWNNFYFAYNFRTFHDMTQNLENDLKVFKT